MKEYKLDIDFEDVISGLEIDRDDEGYKSSKEFHAADFGKRLPSELNLDSRVGMLQKYLFRLNNKQFKWNPAAKEKREDIIKVPDFLVDDTFVKLCVSFSKISNDSIKFQYRDSGFKYFLNEGSVMVVYFIKEDKVAVIGRSNCSKMNEDEEKEAKITAEHIISKVTGKYIDVITVKVDSLIYYDMFKDGDNPEIVQKVKSISEKNSQLPPADDHMTDRYYRSIGKTDGVYNIDLDKQHGKWYVENHNKCLRKWKELIRQSKSEIPGTTKEKREKRRDWVISEFDKFVTEEGIKKYTGNWAYQFSLSFPFE